MGVKYSDEQKTEMVNKINALRYPKDGSPGKQLKEAVAIVKKEKGLEFANIPLYVWWQDHMNGKKRVRAKRAMGAPPSNEELKNILGPISVALDGEGEPAPRNTRSSESMGNLDAEVKLRALALLEKILAK